MFTIKYHDISRSIWIRVQPTIGRMGQISHHVMTNHDRFYLMLKLFDKLAALPIWLRAGRPDLEAAHQRRQSPAYRHRLRRVKTLWLIAGLLMLINPQLVFIAVVALMASLLSFAILDESD